MSQYFGEVIWIPADALSPELDPPLVLCSSDEIDSEVPDDRHVFRAMPGAQVRLIVAECDVEDNAGCSMAQWARTASAARVAELRTGRSRVSSRSRVRRVRRPLRRGDVGSSARRRDLAAESDNGKAHGGDSESAQPHEIRLLASRKHAINPSPEPCLPTMQTCSLEKAVYALVLPASTNRARIDGR
jgi:hypothetical protein